MSLLFSSFKLRDQYVFVNLDFFLTLFHGHFELVLPVFEPVNSVGLGVDGVPEFLDLELHAIVLYECLLLVLEYLIEISVSHLVFKFEFLYLGIKCVALVLDLDDGALDVSAFILELFVGNGELLQGLLLLFELLHDLEYLLVESLGLFLAAFAARPRHLPLHLLNLELRVVQQLLLSLLLLLQLYDVCLQVARGRERP